MFRVDETLAGTNCRRRRPPHPSLLPPGEKEQETRRCPMVTATNTPNLNSYDYIRVMVRESTLCYHVALRPAYERT